MSSDAMWRWEQACMPKATTQKPWLYHPLLVVNRGRIRRVHIETMVVQLYSHVPSLGASLQL